MEVCANDFLARIILLHKSLLMGRFVIFTMKLLGHYFSERTYAAGIAALRSAIWTTRMLTTFGGRSYQEIYFARPVSDHPFADQQKPTFAPIMLSVAIAPTRVVIAFV